MQTPFDPTSATQTSAGPRSGKWKGRALALLVGASLAALIAFVTRAFWIRQAAPQDRTQVGLFLARRAKGLGTKIDPDMAAHFRPDDPELFIPEADALELLPGSTRTQRYDPLSYFVQKPNLNMDAKWPEHPDGHFAYRTNSLGLREDNEIAEQVDVRILVTGDSHVDGFCNNSESYPHVLQALLRERAPGRTVEVVNAADGGYSFYSYLGVIEKYAYLSPRLFVVTVHGGNDFVEVLLAARYFACKPLPPLTESQNERSKKAGALSTGAVFQGLASAGWATDHPEEVDWSLSVALDAVDRMKRVCDAHGTTLLIAYLPSPIEVGGDPLRDRIEPAIEALGLRKEDLDRHAAIGQRFLRAVAEKGIATFDTGPALRASAEPMFWREDLHLSVAGHRVIARAMVDRVAKLAGIGR